METRTLCKKCADHYREAGYLLRVKEFQLIREPCDLCHRAGYEYEILNRSGGEKIECG